MAPGGTPCLLHRHLLGQRDDHPAPRSQLTGYSRGTEGVLPGHSRLEQRDECLALDGNRQCESGAGGILNEMRWGTLSTLTVLRPSAHTGCSSYR